MKELIDVWKRTNVRTHKIEYIGKYKSFHSCGSENEKALITKATFDNFRKLKRRKKKSSNEREKVHA